MNEDTSIDKIKPILHVPIIILHKCDLTANANEITEEYRSQIKNKHIDRANVYFKKQIQKCKDIVKYAEIKFHLILFPVPNKESVVNRFINRANELRNE